jgi:hypothetical protein
MLRYEQQISDDLREFPAAAHTRTFAQAIRFAKEKGKKWAEDLR